MNMNRLLLLLTASSLLLSTTTLAAQPLEVMVSSKPFHSLVAGVMEGHGNPRLLMEGNSSPHTYQLRPRDAQALQRADLIFWGGAEIEPFMVRALETVAQSATAVSLRESDGLALLPVRNFEALEEHDNHDEHDHAGEGFDPHFWLDPLNAVVMVKQITQSLSQLDPSHAEDYRENGARLQHALESLHQTLSQELSGLQQRPFMVYHDSYQYFEKRYQLHSVGTITLHVEYGSSARAMQQVQQRIAEHQVRCVFEEPQFSSRLVQVAVERSQARIGVLDPLGSTLIAGPKLYFDLLKNLSRSLRSCL